MDREYKIIGAFDTETTTIKEGLKYKAFPITYQLGILKTDIEKIDKSNYLECVDVQIYRKHEEFYSTLDIMLEVYKDFVPVILVHNLGFDMYSLFHYFINYEIRPLCKTSTRPIAFTIQDTEGNPLLIFLDTWGLYMKSLDTLGEECGLQKATGSWNYNLIRTPDTPLTKEEEHYAKQDIYTLLVYTSYFLSKNPDIPSTEIGKSIFTKTGIVRYKRLKHLGKLKGLKHGKQVAKLWKTHNFLQAPKTDEELFTMHVCTRGGFTFCSHNHASQVYEKSSTHYVAAYDSTSMHPSMMVSKYYPIDFIEAEPKALEVAIRIIEKTDLNMMLSKWSKPFPVAFNACFEVHNLRLKEGSLFKSEGIAPLARARIGELATALDYDNNTASALFKEYISNLGYHDKANSPIYSFGKLDAANHAVLWLTELSLWELIQAYDYDYIRPIKGFLSYKFRKPTDLDLLSVMRFYQAKNAMKEVKAAYVIGKENNASSLDGLFPDVLVNKISKGRATKKEIAEAYALSKADLNSLFGIAATNEARQNFTFTRAGIYMEGEEGIVNLPKSPKCWYQFGQRIVGWSRVTQIIAMMLVWPYVRDIICGDTDSLKLYMLKDNKADVDRELLKIGRAIDKAKADVCSRVKANYPDYYDPLEGIGYYICEDTFNYFSASWNKSYISSEDGSSVDITLAGIPTGLITHFADNLLKTKSFAEVSGLILGYNVTYDYSLTRLNGRKHPDFLKMYSGYVEDYLGVTSFVYAPAALALYPELKTIGETDKEDNFYNVDYAIKHNPYINIEPILLSNDTMLEERKD